MWKCFWNARIVVFCGWRRTLKIMNLWKTLIKKCFYISEQEKPELVFNALTNRELTLTVFYMTQFFTTVRNDLYIGKCSFFTATSRKNGSKSRTFSTKIRNVSSIIYRLALEFVFCFYSAAADPKLSCSLFFSTDISSIGVWSDPILDLTRTHFDPELPHATWTYKFS